MLIFEGIFDNASDRARFVAIVLSALLVFIGVWYTQWKTDRREKKALQKEKIEEMYRLIAKARIEGGVAINRFEVDVSSDSNKSNELFNKTCDKLEEAHLISVLHFQKSNVSQKISDVIIMFTAAFDKKQDTITENVYTKFMNNTADALNNLASLASKL